MPLAFQNVTVVLETGTGRRDVQLTRRFDAPFASETSVEAVIKGFSLDYTKKDHHLNIAAIDIDILSIRPDLGEVDFLVQVLYGDKNFDDPYNGFVNVLLIAELQNQGNGPVRSGGASTGAAQKPIND